MVSPVQLVETISRTTGLPLPTLVDIDRRLVKGGLRAKGGRGFNVARMTALDAARLLTAVLGSAQSNTAVEAVERYARTRPDRAKSSDGLYDGVEIPELARLPARHGFIDALETLIASVATGGLRDLSSHYRTPHIEVFAFTGATNGRVRVSGLPNGMTVSVEYGAAMPGTPIGDLEQSRRLTERTLWPIGELWSDDNERIRS